MHRTNTAAIAMLILLGLQLLGRAEQVVYPVIDGMTLNLGNYVQRIEVRAKSLGPGFCGVRFTFAGDSSGFLAPPFRWSSWTPVGPAYLGPTRGSLGYTVVCDTGAIAQVRFHK